MQMQQLKLILEGPNLTGKSSIFEALEKKFPDSVTLTIHGYYRPELQNQFQSKEKLAEYLRIRLLPLANIFRDFRQEEVLFNRLHLTDIVYCQIFLNINQDYLDLENKLNKYRVGLVLLDTNDNVIKKRLNEREKSGKAGSWDKEFESIIKKREAYRQAFQRSTIKRKVKIDTSETTAEEAAKKILDWWRNY